MELSGTVKKALLGAAVLASILFAMPRDASSAPLVADHAVVDRYGDIPQYWIDQVKKMWVNVPGESHSSGYRIGLVLLQSLDPRFPANSTESGSPEAYTDGHLRVSRFRWSGSGWALSTGEEEWYTNAAAVANIKAHLAYSNTHGLAIAAMGFGWCWDMSWHNLPGGEIDPVFQVRWAGASVGGPEGDLRWGLDDGDRTLTGNSVSMDTYLAATRQFADYSSTGGYPTKVFYTTGPVDSYNTGENGYQRHLKHEWIREYAAANDGILFDYADILAWGNDNTLATTGWVDWGGGARSFPTIHPDNMKDLDGGYVEDGDHIGERGAVRLAKAMWWMLARIAGWDGTAAGEDATPPSVFSTSPADNASGVSTAAAVRATFSEPVLPETVTASTFTVGGVTGTVSVSGSTATFTPSAPLATDTAYTATVTTGITDVAGNPLAADHSWSFVTGAGGSSPSGGGGGGGCSVAGKPGGTGAAGAFGFGMPLLLLLAARIAASARGKRKGR